MGSLGTPDVHARRDPDRAAIWTGRGGTATSYGALRDGSRTVATRLRADGTRAGDTVAILVENRPEALIAALGARRSGLRYTMLSTRFTAAEIGHVVADSGATAVISSAAYAEAAAAGIAVAASRPRLYSVDNGTEGCADLLVPADFVPEDREGADMLYSSGTTGKPKGVVTELPDAGFGAAPDPIAALLTARWGFDTDTVYLSPAPLYHAAPLRFSMATHRFGGQVVLMESFDPLALLELIERHRVTHMQLVPTMMVRLLKLSAEERGGFDLRSLEVLIHAAAPCPPEVKRQTIEWLGPVVHEYYSSTENYLFTAIDSEEALARPGSVGRPLLGIPHIVDEGGGRGRPRRGRRDPLRERRCVRIPPR